jgi:hypothetical protein
MPFESVSTFLFDNKAFWQHLAVSADDYDRCTNATQVQFALGRLHNLLTLSRGVRAQLLEYPETATKVAHRNSPTKNAAEKLLFLQPLSILHRAVEALVGFYDPSRPGRTAFYITNAAKFFAMSMNTVKGIRANNKKLLVDSIEDEAERRDAINAKHAADYSSRIPCMQLLRIVMKRKGGFRRIAQLAKARERYASAAHARLAPIIEGELNTFKTFIKDLRSVTAELKGDKLRRFKHKAEGLMLKAEQHIGQIFGDIHGKSGESIQYIRKQLLFIRRRMRSLSTKTRIFFA